MVNVNPYYKDFVNYKINSYKTYINLFKKIRSLEDLRYLLGLTRLALKIAITKSITNETLRDR
jgi:hypothetical protein